jgi:hypothetical protein
MIKCRYCDDQLSDCPNRFRDLSLPRVRHSFDFSPDDQERIIRDVAIILEFDSGRDVTMDELIAVNSKPRVVKRVWSFTNKAQDLRRELKDEWSMICQQQLSVELSVVIGCVMLVLGMMTWECVMTRDYMKLATVILFGVATTWVSNANENQT